MSQNLLPEQLNLLKTLQPELEDLCVKFAIKGGAFLSTIFYSVGKEFSYDISTAATNGRVILFNPEFFQSLTKEERLFVLAHEVLHIVFFHFIRMQNRNPKIWNMAGDYVINYELRYNFDNVTMPMGGLFNPAYGQMTTEEIYDILIKDEDAAEEVKASCKFALDDLIEDDLTSAKGETFPVASKEEIGNVILQAENVARMQGVGNTSNAITNLISSLKSVCIDWYSLLIDLVSKRVKDSYSFTKRNRRYSHMYLPSMHSLGMDCIAVYMDVSSSVEMDTLRRFLGAIQDIKDLCKPETLKIIPFNTNLLKPFIFSKDEDIPNALDFDIYGGTDIDPCLQDIQENGYDISIVFSDGIFGTIHNDIPENIFWTIYDDKAKAFEKNVKKGTIIYVD